MSFKDYVVPTLSVPLAKGQSVSLTGLSLESIATLVRIHEDELQGLFTILMNAREMSGDDFAKMAAPVASQAPGLVANIIALSAGEFDMAPTVARVPLPKQIELLIAVGKITFEEPGSVKKTWEMITSLLPMIESEKTAAAKKTSRVRK